MSDLRPIGARFYHFNAPYFSGVPEGSFSTIYARTEYEVVGHVETPDGDYELVRAIAEERCDMYFNGTRWLPVVEAPGWLREHLT